jgi:5-methylcytosine-specific restriction protein A
MPWSPPSFRADGLSAAEVALASNRARGLWTKDGYGRRWKRLRLAFLRQHPLCMCDEGCNQPATEVDHKIPHRGDEALMWDWDNLQSLTKECHSRKTAREGPRPRR